MPTGLQMWDTQGRLTLDLTDRLSRYLGLVWTGGSDGSIQVPAMALGQGWVGLLEDSFQFFGKPPNVYVSGITVSWNWPAGSGNNQGATIIYGVF